MQPSPLSPRETFDRPETIGQWSLRIRYLVSHPVTSSETAIEVLIQDRLLRFSSSEGGSLQGATHLLIEGHGFASEEEAYSFAVALKTAMTLATVERGMGVDFGQDASTLSFSAYVVSAVEEKLQRTMLPNIHGIHVFKRTGREFLSPRVGVQLHVSEPSEIYF